MAFSFELRRLSATLIFDLRDEFARLRGTRGPFPRPFEPIKFFATAHGVGPNRRVFNPPLEFVVQRNGNGYHVFHNVIKQADGTVMKRALAAGTYDINVDGRFYQRVRQANIAVPTSNRPIVIDLQPAYSYPFPFDLKPTGGRGFALLRGGLHSPDGRPLAGHTVSVAGANGPYVTDDQGQWVLVFPDSFFPANQTTAAVTVQVTPPTGPVVNVAGVNVDKGSERALSESALRGWVLERGRGTEGATIQVQGQPGQSRTNADGGWFYYLGINHSAAVAVDVTAELPNGNTLVQNQMIQPRATVIVPPFQFP